MKSKLTCICFLLLSMACFMPRAHSSDLGVDGRKQVELEYEGNTEVLKGYINKVPSGTKLEVIVETPIQEGVSQVGDGFSAKIPLDIEVNNNVVLPAGSIVTGRILKLIPAKRLHRSGKAKIEFESITTPDGREIPIVASVLSRGGVIKGKYNGKRALISTATLAGPAIAGFGAGLAAEGSPLGGVLGAGIGTVAGIGAFFYQRGNMVEVKSGDELKIELVEDAFVPNKLALEEVDLENEGDIASRNNVSEVDFTEEAEEVLEEESEARTALEDPLEENPQIQKASEEDGLEEAVDTAPEVVLEDEVGKAGIITEEELTEREKELRAREEKLKAREEELKAREEELARKEERMKNKEKTFEELEKKLEGNEGKQAFLNFE